MNDSLWRVSRLNLARRSAEKRTMSTAGAEANCKGDTGTTSSIVKTAAEWESQNIVLGAGVFGFDSTNKIIKAGDGVTPWKTLPTLLSTDFSFGKASWSDIAALSESGSADKYFSVGDEKTIPLTTG